MGHVEPHFESRGYARHCRLYCAHCNHVQHWLQYASADGKLLNHIVSGPGFIKDYRIIAKFLREHPEAAGVLQS